MDKQQTKIQLTVLNQISKDCEEDVKRFNMVEFNGRNVAQYFGAIGAQIDAVARILSEHIEVCDGGKK